MNTRPLKFPIVRMSLLSAFRNINSLLPALPSSVAVCRPIADVVAGSPCAQAWPAKAAALRGKYSAWRNVGVVCLLAAGIVSGSRAQVAVAPSPTWVQQSPASAPSARADAAMAYDPAIGKVVLFGGATYGDLTTYLNDTWTYDVTTSTWTQQSPANSPPVLAEASMVYDPAIGKLVLFGGTGSVVSGSGVYTYPIYAQTWTYDGTTWTQQSPATSPPARYSATMIYDAALGQVLLFGGTSYSEYYNSGYNFSGNALSDTWTYDGTTWTQQSPANNPATGLGEGYVQGIYGAAGTYDAATGQPILFGGGPYYVYSTSTTYEKYLTASTTPTWAFTGSTWTDAGYVETPPDLVSPTMQYDPNIGSPVLFGGWVLNEDEDTLDLGFTAGGQSDGGSIPLLLGTDSNLTFVLDGKTWVQQSIPSSPSGRSNMAAAYDPASGEIVLFGGGDSNYNEGNGNQDFNQNNLMTGIGDTWAYQAGSVAQNLGNANLCSGGSPTPCSTTQTLSFTFSASGTIEAPSVVTQGATNLDFTDAGTGTCTTNGSSHSYAVGATCTVVVNFTPTAPGLRTGAVNLLNSSGAVVSSVPLYGTGTGPELLFQVGTPSTTYSTTLGTANGLSVDGSGNVYVANTTSSGGSILKYAPGSTTPTTLATVSGGTQATAVDGAGNVYYGGYGSSGWGLYELVGGTGTPVFLTALPNADVADYNLSLDRAGNLYTTGGTSGAIYVYYAAGHTLATLVAGVSGRRLEGMAIDSSGNLFAADELNSILYELPQGSTSLVTLTSGGALQFPEAVAVDAADNVYVSLNGGGLLRYTAGNFTATPSTPAISAQQGLAIGATGMFYTLNGTNLYAYNRTANPALSFATTGLGQTSSDSPQTVSPENDGNASLSIASTALSSSTNFTVANNTCGSTLASAGVCSFTASFTPVATGSLSATETITDNTLNATWSTQTIGLSGYAIEDTVYFGTMTFSPAASQVQGTNQAITIADTVSYDYVQPGAISFYWNSTYFPATCTSTGSPETCTATAPVAYMETFSAGTYTVYPIVAYNADYNQETGPNGTFTITPAPTSFTAPTEPVGTTSTTQTAYVNITTAGTTNATLGTAIQVVMQGFTGMDYAYVSGGTCAANTAYPVGRVCTVQYTFTPKAPGVRMGAVVLMDSTGTVVLGTSYIAGTGTGPLVGVTPGTISTVAGNGTAGSTGDGATATSAEINTPYSVTVDGAGNQYIADEGSNRIRKVTAATGYISTVAGGGTGTFAAGSACPGTSADTATDTLGDGCPAYNATTPADSVNLSHPSAVAIDGAGNLYIADYNNSRIRKVAAATGIITVVAGGGTATFTAGSACPGTSADTATDTLGDGCPAYNATTQADSASMSGVQSVAVDGAGNLYIADFLNSRIRKVTASTGIMTTVAGGGTYSFTGSGSCPVGGGTETDTVGDGCLAYNATTQADSAELNRPLSVAVDGSGNLYIADYLNSRIRKVAASTGIITTVAGNGTACTTSSTTGCSDGSIATSAELHNPVGVAVDVAGNLYIGDNGDARTRKVTLATQIITTVAGTGTAGYVSAQDGGAATSAELDAPFGVTVDSAGNLYIADSVNNRIREVTVAASPVTFATSTHVGSTDTTDFSGGVFTLTLANNGNSALTFSVPAVGTNPSIPSGFTIGGTSTCPQLTTASSTGTLDSGASCTDLISFKPVTSGSISGLLETTDNNLNVTASAQDVSLSGTATAATGATAQTITFPQPGSVAYGTPVTLAATASSGLPVYYTVTGQATVTGSTLTFTGLGSVIVTAYQNGNGTYAAATPVSDTVTVLAPAVSVGSTSSTITATMTITTAGTTSATLSTAIQVVTQGLTGLDFAYVSGGTCAVNTAYTAGQTCTVKFNFTPGAPGVRLGAIELFTGSGTAPLATTYISGTGNGPLAGFTPGTISVLAGGGTASTTSGTACPGTPADIATGSYGDGCPAYNGTTTTDSSVLSEPVATAVDAGGNLYIADTNHNRIRKVTAATGIISTVAYGGTATFTAGSACPGTPADTATDTYGDGCPAYNATTLNDSASLGETVGITLDGAGNLYIADGQNDRVREVIAATGIITTIAGGGTASFTAGSACPGTPVDTATDIYGDGCPAVNNTTSADGAAVAPLGLAVDGVGNLYIADRTHDLIRKISAATGIITAVAGNGTACTTSSTTGCLDGAAATSAELDLPYAVAVDGAGNLYIADLGDQRIREVTAATGIITTIAGTGTAGYVAAQDGGVATSAEVDDPAGIAVDGAGNLYIGDEMNNRLRKVTVATGIITTIAGTGTNGYVAAQNGGAATSAELDHPEGVTVDGAGNLYIADTSNNRVREVTAAASPIAFATSTPVGTTDTTDFTGGVFTLTLTNNGNTALTFPVPGSGTDPSISAGFTIGGGSTCPQLTTASSAGTLASGATCTDLISFAPVAAGSNSGSLVTTDNNTATTGLFSGNSTSPTQSVSLSGTATAIAPTTATVSAVTAPYGSTTGVTVTATESGSAGAASSVVTFGKANGVGGSFLPTTCTITSGSCTTTYTPSGTTTVGVYTNDITASFAAAGNYTSTNVTSNLTITAATPTFGTMTFSPAAIEGQGTSQIVTISDTVTYGGVQPTGAVKFVLNGVTYTATCTTAGSPETCSATVPAATIAALAVNPYTVTAALTADTNYNAATGTSGSFNITADAFVSLSVSGFISTATLTESGTVTVTAKNANGTIDPLFTGTVTLTSSDAHATLPAAYTFQSSDAGVHVFTVTLNTLGTQSITATSGSVTGSQTGIMAGDAIWLLNAAGTLVKLNQSATAVTSGIGTSGTAGTHGGVAFDSSGNAWSVGSGSNMLYFATSAGGSTTSYSGGGLNTPVAVAVDGQGYIWVANSGNASISGFKNTGTALGGTYGLGAKVPGYSPAGTAPIGAGPSAIAIDNTGGVWVTSQTGSSVTHILGVGTPVTTPIAAAVKNSTVGTKP